ncbi:MAG: hypothetical protein JWO86_6352 [Myxococcaceae bacterium]|nr:hypothetical protein [Myxococcaceae bacterium]
MRKATHRESLSNRASLTQGPRIEKSVESRLPHQEPRIEKAHRSRLPHARASHRKAHRIAPPLRPPSLCVSVRRACDRVRIRWAQVAASRGLRAARVDAVVRPRKPDYGGGAAHASPCAGAANTRAHVSAPVARAAGGSPGRPSGTAFRATGLSPASHCAPSSRRSGSTRGSTASALAVPCAPALRVPRAPALRRAVASSPYAPRIT